MEIEPPVWSFIRFDFLTRILEQGFRLRKPHRTWCILAWYFPRYFQVRVHISLARAATSMPQDGCFSPIHLSYERAEKRRKGNIPRLSCSFLSICIAYSFEVPCFGHGMYPISFAACLFSLLIIFYCQQFRCVSNSVHFRLWSLAGLWQTSPSLARASFC